MENRNENRIGVPSQHQSPAGRLHKVLDERDKTLWQRLYSLLLLAATLFVETSDDPVLDRLRCDAFLNILSFGLERKSADLQKMRLSTAWIMRTATAESSTGYGKDDTARDYGIRSMLRFKLPYWVDYIIVVLVFSTLLTQGAFVLYHRFALPQAFDTVAIHCGKILAKHTARCMKRVWKSRTGQKDCSDDFTVQFGMTKNSDGLASKSLVEVEYEDRHVQAAHLEWGLPDEVIPVGFVSGYSSKRENPDYIGAFPAEPDVGSNIDIRSAQTFACKMSENRRNEHKRLPHFRVRKALFLSATPQCRSKS